jgi:DNA-directed RNA polymerase subunit L
MKIEIIEEEKDSIEFSIEGERHTIPSLLKEKLSENSDVEFVAYKLDHPLDEKAKFVLKAKDAKKVLVKGIDDLKKDIEEFRISFNKA